MKKTSIFLNVKRWNKLGLFSLAMLAAASTYAQDVTTGLKALYSFESVAGGVVNDDSGNGLSATVFGAATAIPGYSGNSMNFPTVASPAADYLLMPNDFTTSVTDFTVATWVKVDNPRGWARIFDFGANTSNYMFLCPNQGSATGNLRFAIRTTSVNEQQLNGPSGLTTGQWAHVAVTLSGTTGTLYVNGAVVATNTSMTLNPSSLGSTTQNYIAKSQWPDPGFNGSLDDFRFYSRALTRADILKLMGYPVELDQQKALLTAKYLTTQDSMAVTSNITLPTQMGPNVTVKWASSNNSIIDTFGVVTRPNIYQAPVRLTATLSQTVNGKVYTATKDIMFIVAGPTAVPDFLATWNFDTDKISSQNGVITVVDNESGFVGTCKNGARIRTIGDPSGDQFNVVDLGSNNGYFDMGTEFGKAMYGLADYTVQTYFRLPENFSFSGNGHFLWYFANRDSSTQNPIGNIILGLNNQRYAISPTTWYGEQGLETGTNAGVGAWHHMCFAQKGNVGTLYVDGAQVAQNTTMTNVPGITLRRNDQAGTLCNWLGKSGYTGDAYTPNALYYGFQLLNVAVSGDDLTQGDFAVPTTLGKLNAAYTANPDYVSTSIITEASNLSIGDTTAVTANLTLPTSGILDPTISIAWASNHNEIISNTGVVTSPFYHAYKVKLTATLSKGVQTVTKVFNVNVLPKAGTEFTNNLVVKYDFSNVTNDTIVTDGAEKHFTGIVKNDAKIRTIGTSATGTYKVLSLGDSLNTKGYFDMGTEVGKVMYGLSDYTVGAYYRIDPAYTALSSNGNFLWNFSNSKDIINDPTGYMIGSLRNQAATITGGNWGGEQTVALGSIALTGNWHHFLYAQKDTIGTIYVDGMVVQSGTVKQNPINTLVKDQRLGTLYNWIGRSCYTGDVYLRQALVADFRVYSKALTEEEIQTGLAINDMMGALDAAYAANTGMSVASVKASQYKVIASEGLITIQGLNGGEKVSLFDITGRQFKVTTPSSITVKSGMYIVKVNDYVTKVIVK
ncbi:LamG-like jellyroll fold domain-containing protein [Parabacteroides sp. FAFU027]|uniref:LamG-like jellyroll fold domain-containing protein n=1 Tax=Parabacteroides sp. FAFU027 TaxID=2922715 RepID=UPI001FAF5967|nr:LamG-like jellyroll fold domain-containing protein [Parabacteroides sp. FAFU027]